MRVIGAAFRRDRLHPVGYLIHVAGIIAEQPVEPVVVYIGPDAVEQVQLRQLVVSEGELGDGALDTVLRRGVP